MADLEQPREVSEAGAPTTNTAQSGTGGADIEPRLASNLDGTGAAPMRREASSSFSLASGPPEPMVSEYQRQYCTFLPSPTLGDGYRREKAAPKRTTYASRTLLNHRRVHAEEEEEKQEEQEAVVE